MTQIQAEFLTEKQVSELTGIPVPTLQNQRYYSTGLPYIKVGRLVRYSLEEVREYMKKATVHPLN